MLPRYEAALSRSGRDHPVVGAMVGRDACKRPWYYANVDTALFGAPRDAASSRRDLLDAYGAYAAREEAAATDDYSPRRALLKPVLSLFHGDAGTGAFKRDVDALHRDRALSVRDVLRRAAARVPDAVLDAPPAFHAPSPQGGAEPGPGLRP